MNWKYYNPKFEYEDKFNDSGWPWAGHKCFAYDFVANLKPRRIVELGTYYGTSLWSFAQAAKDNNLDIEFNAIDTWQGEKHSGFYGEEVFETVNCIRNSFYSELNMRLIRSVFDEALIQFENESVDILHIDGLHTYDAVRHDFEVWLPKVKKDGAIIFHDIKVGESDFGVYRLWNELKSQYLTIEFHHSFGLGVLFMNEKYEEFIVKREEELQRYYYYLYESSRGGELKSLSHAIEQKDQEIQTKDQEIQTKDQEIQTKDQEIQTKDQELNIMKASNFWKLRQRYLFLKHGLRFTFFSPVKFIKKYLHGRK